jgi:superfamily II DNA or RNA helicase
MFDIVWDNPSPVHTRNGTFYVRQWKVPPELVDGFLSFWEKSPDLKDNGFYIKKELDGLYLHERRRFISGFYPIGKNKRDSEPKFSDVDSLSIVPIKDSSGLKDWQPDITARLCAAIRKYDSAIDGSDLGTGKSYCAVAVARELSLNIAVICPKAVVTSWKRVIEGHFNMKSEFVLNYESIRTGGHSEIGVWKRINPLSNAKLFTWTYKNPKNTLLIFDESHKLKNWDSQNSQIAIAAKKAGFKILCLSATNSVDPVELRTVGKIIGLHSGGNKEFNKFLTENDCEKTLYGWKFNGSENVLKCLNHKIFKERGARVRKEEIPSFPECDLTAELYDLDKDTTDRINKIYSDMEEELINLENTVKNQKSRSKTAMVARIRARQKCELLKIPLILDMINDALDSGMSVVVFLNFSETIRALAKKLMTDCIIWGEDVKDRQKHIDDFQADRKRVILVNIKAGNAGISFHDLHGNHPRLALISPTESAVDLKQCTGRIWRTGAKTKSVQKIFFISGTIEEKICQQMKTKLNNMDLINDGDLSSNRIFK